MRQGEAWPYRSSYYIFYLFFRVLILIKKKYKKKNKINKFNLKEG